MEIKEKKFYRNFIIAVGLIIALGVSAIYLGMAIRNSNLIREGIVDRAKAHFDGIVVTRKWNALHGGVYVEKKPGMVSNPYLVNPDIHTTDGKTYTQKNPALMTREISELSRKNSLFFFHITSLKPINPGNAADEFERRALERFELKREKEFYSDVLIDGRNHFRYMAPLLVEKSCLQCHAFQGYREGDVRGGISVWFDIDEATRKLKSNLLAIFVLSLMTVAFLIALIYFFFRQLRLRLEQARAMLERMSKTDMLTEVANRRHLMERFNEELERAKRIQTPLSCIILDVDHFKAINDSLGHLKGDEVLKGLAGILQQSIRAYDILGRYGGEEFLVVAPDTKPAEAEVLARRIREKVEMDLGRVSLLPDNRVVTISLGLACRRQEDQTVEELINRADAALYRAKANGRNRLETEDAEA